ncbi:hypothetical protein [Pararhodobacter oceanensis]|uniref:Lipoprotein n=1 Tax=Pararhodobacter oceanensis TaxID=2172121 RepID=A0A2T8HYX5_9RHOB|nr:hypothetical protein [Pararhodobacter oceanensis]PVH30601.1 hypothetical protein DDE20_03510 [Pararhodobacter oceanensis]
MKPVVLLCLVALIGSGCSSPGHAYFGVAPRSVEIDGRRYDVYARLDRLRPEVQVIRMGYARRPEHIAILEAMVQAAEQATGCSVIAGSAVGDSGVMNARLSCSGG